MASTDRTSIVTATSLAALSESASSSQITPTTTVFNGRPNYQFGPPGWVSSAIEQYQASLRSASQSTTSSPTTLVTTTRSSISSIATATASTTPSSPDTTSGNQRVKQGVGIAFGVSLVWLLLILALAYWWIRRRRRARQSKDSVPSDHQSSSVGSTASHPCVCQCHEAEGSPGEKRNPELHDTHRVEMKGSLGPLRTELPA
ncbi:MAG: hypothetical protein Q9186_004695 [Xanthomendoza sp. 1 TL-2023]